jgi:uncharacterized protein (TIGR03546 family)
MIKILPKPIRKIIAVFRGQVSPVFIFFSLLLGFWFGLTPGWSGLHTVLVILVLVLNIHLGLFLLSAGLGKTLCLAGAPVLYHVGAWMHDYFSGLLGLLASIPVIGITDFDRYSVAGALVIGPVIGGVAGLLLARSVISFRRMLLKLEEGSEQFKKWYSNRWVRILDRLLVGKRTKEAKALFSAKTKIIRMPGVVVAVLVLAVSISAAALLKNEATRDYVVAKMTQANGAEVNVDRLGISALAGAFSATGVEVTDPEEPRKNQVSVGKVAADISLYDLLLGKLVMERVEVVDVDFGTDRAAPGDVVQRDAEQTPDVFDPCDFALGTGDISKLETYLKDAKAVKGWLQKVSKWLPEGKDKESESDAEEMPQEYLGYLQARAATPASPRILAEKVLLDKVRIPSQLFGSSKISLENISDSVQAAGLPVKAAVKSYDTPVVLAITFDYASAENGPLVSGTFGGVDLRQMQSDISSNAGLAFTKGTASGQFDGLITRDAVDLTVDLTIRDMQATSQGDGILGLGSKTTSEALEVIENLHTKIRIVGPVNEPRLVFDVKGLQEEFKNALVKAGKAKLAEEIDRQIEKQLGEEVPGEVGDVLKKPGGLIEGIGGLFGGDRDKQKEED